MEVATHDPHSPQSELDRRLADWTLQLVKIPSETGNEAPLADWLEGQLERLVDPHAIIRLGHSLIVRCEARERRPTIALFGHTDTVKASSDQPIEIRDGRVFGCGASDMKGALAVMLELLSIHRLLAGANLVFVFYEKEEGPSRESVLPALLATPELPQLDLGLCLEPTDNRIHAGCLGGIHATCVIRGRRAHSARPWQGHNAILAAIPVLERLRQSVPKEVMVRGLLFREVLSVTQASTSNSRNVIPDQLFLNVNYRFAPGKSLIKAREELQELVFGNQLELDLPHGYSLEVIDEAPAGEVCSDHPLIEPWRQAEGLELEAKQAWTDVAQLTHVGIPAINFGPGDTAQAHQASESISIASMARNFLALRHLLERLS